MIQKNNKQNNHKVAYMEIETMITNYGKNKQRIITPKWCDDCKKRVFKDLLTFRRNG